MTLDGRPRGILSPADREYLRNPDEYSKQAGYERRRAIVERLHEALHDMPLLVSELDEDLRTEAFEDGELDGKEHTINVLHSAFALLYLGITDTVEPEELAKDAFESMAASGVAEAYRSRGEPVADVSVSVEITPIDSSKPVEEMTLGEIQEHAKAGNMDPQVLLQRMTEAFGEEREDNDSAFDVYDLDLSEAEGFALPDTDGELDDGEGENE